MAVKKNQSGQAPVSSTKEDADRRPPRLMAEFAIEPHDQELILTLQAHIESQGERRQRARILRESSRHGLLLEIIMAGPDKNGLYAGRYSGRELAEKTRMLALLLADLQSRYSTPILAVSQYVPATQPVSQQTRPETELPGSDAQIDKSGAAALKGLGAGLMTRKSSAPPPPPPS